MWTHSIQICAIFPFQQASQDDLSKEKHTLTISRVSLKPLSTEHILSKYMEMTLPLFYLKELTLSALETTITSMETCMLIPRNQ